MRFRQGVALGMTIAAGAALVPGAASATVSCSHGAGVLTITADGAAFETPSMQRNGTTIEIRAVAGPTTVACAGGTPTTVNTDTINFVETGGGASEFFISVGGGEYAPGLTNEAGSSDEIEINVSVDGGGDSLLMNGTSGVENLRFGQNGGTILGNLNGAEADGLDSDLSATGLDNRLLIRSLGASGDTVTANGGASVPGSTAPVGIQTYFEGEGGNDVLAAGSSTPLSLGNANVIDGGADDDILTAGANGGVIEPGAGNDTVTGGASGNDTVSYLNLPGGVTLDLSDTTQQDSGGQGLETITGVESFQGSNGADTVTGTSGANTLLGVGGDDVLDGGLGNDSFAGGTGTDTVTYADAAGGVTFSLAGALNSPQATGGAGTDTLVDAGEVGGSAHLIENLVGSPQADALTGNAAGNELDGGPGADSLLTLGGADTILARDGVSDTVVDCGADAGDFAEVDQSPFDPSVAGCETVDRPPSPPPVDPGGPTGQRAAALKKCKKKKGKARKKCIKKAKRLPV